MLGDDHRIAHFERVIDRLKAENAALVRVVEKLLRSAYLADGGHTAGCRWPYIEERNRPCTCGADEARALLAKIRGEK